MWIEKLDNGKYKYIERYTDPLTGKDRKVSLTHTKNNGRIKKEMIIMLQAKIEKNLNDRSAKITFKELCDKFLPVYQKTVKVSTYGNNSSYLRMLNRDIGDILIEKLDASVFNNLFLSLLVDYNYKYDTVKNVKSTVINVLKFADEYGYLNTVEMQHRLKVPKINLPPSNEWKYLEKKELKTVIDQLKENNVHNVARMFLIQTYTGLRYGELVSLDYNQHIDFKEKTIKVERTWYHRKRLFQTPKSSSTRVIHFNAETEKLLKEQIIFAKMKKVEKNLDRDNYLLFSNNKNEPFANSYANEMLHKYVDIPDKVITTHIFRHTFITLMIENNVELTLIAKHVGHANTNMIQKVYGHFTKKMNNNLDNAIDNFSLSL